MKMEQICIALKKNRLRIRDIIGLLTKRSFNKNVKIGSAINKS